MNGGSIAERLASLARDLDAESEPTVLLQRVVEAAVEEVPGAEHAGVTVIGKRWHAWTPATTDPIVTRLDTLQYEAGEGPCLEAALEDPPIVRSADLAAEPRWPGFSAAAVELGARSVVSFRLFSAAGTVGALNLYASVPNAFGHEAEEVGVLLAAHAAVSLAASIESADLKIALQSRDVIGQAKGILMERYRVDDHRAFSLLVAVSRQQNLKLREVAEYLASTGEFTPIDPTSEGPPQG